MKKLLFFSFVLALNHNVLSDDSTDLPFAKQVAELNQKYQPYYPYVNARVPDYPATEQEHLTDEYRPIWEQLYRESLLGAENPYLNTMHKGYMTGALIKIASTNTIPMLVDVYTKLLETNKDTNQEKQQEIITILFNFDAKEAIDAIFTLLDISDKKYGENSPYQKENNMTLREWIWQSKLNPEYRQRAVFVPRQERIERAEKWRGKFNTYTNANLSTKNELFMEKARNLSRLPEKRNKNAEVPLP